MPDATFLSEEYSDYQHPLYGVGAYTLATATAAGRQLNNRHWISDVLAGAGIGILSTKLGYIIADAVFKDKGERAPLRKNPLPVTDKPSFIEIRAGFATATSRDLTAKASALWAKSGFNMGVDGAWFFHKNIGIGAEFAFSSFPMNDDALVFSDPDVDTASYGHYTQPMGIRYLHIGPFFSFPLPYNWFVTGKLTAGTSQGAKGGVMLKLREEYQEFFGATELPYLQYKPEAAFSWSAGIGIQKRISRNLAIKAYASYFDSDHDFKVDQLSEIDQDGKYTYTNIGVDKVRFDNLSLGFALTAFLW